MANVYDVADFFIELANQDEEGEITNLKLQKLLFFAQSHFLAATGKPLFDNPIKAWDLGPVVPEVYEKYKSFERSPILSGRTAPQRTNIPELFSDEEYAILLDVAREYCKYTAAYLVKKTHEAGTPWAETTRNAVIDNGLIARYFSENEKIISFDSIISKKNIPGIGRRDTDGLLVLPADEDDDYWDNCNEV
jgi:uncharacterized phage-associated protein